MLIQVKAKSLFGDFKQKNRVNSMHPLLPAMHGLRESRLELVFVLAGGEMVRL